MNDEIKEILDNISDNIEYYYVGTNGCLYQDLTKEQLLLIKDYITNLQEENDILNDITESYEETSKEEQEEMEKLQQRIDKAIEFIKENSGYDEEISSCCDDLLYSDCDKLIELLGGEE